MKNTEEIVTKIYHIVKDSSLMTYISGKGGDLYRDVSIRPVDDKNDAIVIGILDNTLGIYQYITANLNIYISDIRRSNAMVIDSKTINEVTALAMPLFDRTASEGFRFSIENQSIYEVTEKAQHCINLRLNINYLNK